MRIEALSPARRHRNCLQVTPEAGAPFLITEQELLSFELRPGMELEEEQMTALRQAADRSLALRQAAALLAVRDRSRRELTDQLVRKGVSEENAELAADRMVELGVLNDAAYAAAWVRRGVSRGWGPRRVESELYRRGISRELWSDALDIVEDWTAVAADFVSRRRGDLSDPAARKKLSDALARRGFDWDCIREVLHRAEEEQKQD